MDNKQHLLIISKGLLYTLNNVNRGKHKLLANKYTGDYTHLVIDKDLKNVKSDSFTLLGCYLPEFFVYKLPFITTVYFFLFEVSRIIFRHFFVKKYDFIISRDPVFSGIMGFFISKVLRRPLIVEFNGNYSSPVVWEDQTKTFLGRLKFSFIQKLIPLICKCATKIKLLYPSHASKYVPQSDNNKLHIFHEYTPVSSIVTNNTLGDYILFMGSPWKIKGVDLLINAFNTVKKNHPDINLRVYGWFPNGADEYLQSLVKCDGVIINHAVEYDEALSLISGCRLLVLPSRTEAMGRVLLEAMACGKAVIGSDADGIPTYINHEYNGLIFEKENVKDLEEKISILLRDAELIKQLGENGKQLVFSELSENSYLLKYSLMLDSVRD